MEKNALPENSEPRRFNWAIVYVNVVSLLCPAVIAILIAIGYFGDEGKKFTSVILFAVLLAAAIVSLVVITWVEVLGKRGHDRHEFRKRIFVISLCFLAVLTIPTAFVSICASTGFLTGLVANPLFPQLDHLIIFAFVVGTCAGAFAVYGVAYWIKTLIRRRE